MEAPVLRLLLHLSWVGRWGPVGPQGDCQGPPVCHSMAGRGRMRARAVRLPQNLFGSFTLQGPGSSVLKPDLKQTDGGSG